MIKGSDAKKHLRKIVTVRGRRFLFRVEDSTTPPDYLKYEELRNAIWQYPEDHLPGARNMMCGNFFHEGGSLFIGVFGEDEKGIPRVSAGSLVGFCYGFVGVRDKAVGFRRPDNLLFYSQYLGIREDLRGHGLAVLLKEFQKEQVLRLFGTTVMTCTFDPLTAVNASRNIARFGMKVLAYRTDIYGDFGGLLNRLDIPRDRFFVSWDIKKGASRPDYDPRTLRNPENQALFVEDADVAGKNGLLKLEIAKAVRSAPDRDLLAVAIPSDFYRMLRETDVGDEKVRRIPLDWRMKTRQTFRSLLERGYTIIDFRAEREPSALSAYVLKKNRNA